MFDVAIVGARCAGSALALLLARAGLKVLVVDRTVFPSDTISGHYIQPAGVSCLRRWGLGDRLGAGDTPAQATLTFDFGPFSVTGSPVPDADGNSVGFGPRRFVFDPMLAAAAVEAGAELWEGVTVRSLVVDADRVVGFSGANRAGQTVTARARLVVGADGKRSRIAELVRAAKYRVRSPLTCMAYSYFSGFAAPHTHLFARDGRFFVVLPTSHGLTFVGTAWPVRQIAELRSAPQAMFESSLAEVPWIADRVRDARREERVTTMADLEGFFRVSHGPGWALLGDAGYHRDPITAQGMSDAFRQAQWLATAVLDGFAGRRALEDALAQFQRQRDAALLPMYELTCTLARLEPPPPALATRLARLTDDAAAAGRFFGAIAGTVPVQAFFEAPPAAA